MKRALVLAADEGPRAFQREVIVMTDRVWSVDDLVALIPDAPAAP